jgi:hypothetical protein
MRVNCSELTDDDRIRDLELDPWLVLDFWAARLNAIMGASATVVLGGARKITVHLLGTDGSTV